ncbi:hypothetical protein Sru01_07860 [Sphaerisporangium rufum]|uniref:Bacterial Ig-like domain-containing protein n=1 Tax=Sphaerisporangium rufum TaxID=1381558 RepID=A0A919QX85_9ACTN|nr:Ig-like domain repeat protein [Sphaerisporangium rufum]GII75804.1 hypothetical protein Sru01_07860 [Sphaerisporangium rufum]
MLTDRFHAARRPARRHRLPAVLAAGVMIAIPAVPPAAAATAEPVPGVLDVSGVPLIPTVLTATAEPDPVPAGGPVTVQVRIAELRRPGVAARDAAGEVTFTEFGTLLGAAPVVHGNAAFMIGHPGLAVHHVRVAYGGDATHGGSAATVTFTVTAAR